MTSLTVGLVLGVIVSLLKLPLPAPSSIGGILGIVGLYLGYIIVNNL